LPTSFSWENPSDASGIARVYYKIGEQPASLSDTTGSSDSIDSLEIDLATAGIADVYLWLEDGAGNADYNQWAHIKINYDPTAPANPQSTLAWTDDTRDQRLEDNRWNNHSIPHFKWGEGQDALSGVAGYAVEFSQDSSGVVGAVISTLERSYSAENKLVSGATYYLRIRTVDQAGNWSLAKTLFTYHFDEEPPQIEYDPPASWLLGQDFIVEATANDTSGLEQATLFYRRGGTDTFTELIMRSAASDRYIGTVPGENISYDGLDYYIKATDLAGNERVLQDSGTAWGLQVTFQELLASKSFPVDQWRMVSVPVQLDNGSPVSILRDLGPYDINQWRLYRYFGDRYNEFTDTDIGDFTPGRAFWFNTRSDGLVLRSGSGSTSPTNTAFEIVLSPGWNDIATPYNFAVDWGEILVASGMPARLQGPYTYDGTAWSFPQITDRLEPWEGYIVNNANDGFVLLRIPRYKRPEPPR